MTDRPAGNHISKLILVVEDSPVQALALTRLLEGYGLDVLCASNGQSGVAMARSYLPDLIILDVQMPEMNGLEACQQIKADPLTGNLPVILFTAHDSIDIMKMGLDQGAVDFIPKDAFSDVVLIETLRQLHLVDNDPADIQEANRASSSEKG